jgi:hypothetical protein
MICSPNLVFRCPAAVLEVVVRVELVVPVEAAVAAAVAVDIDFHRVVAVGCHSNFHLVAVAADTVDFRSVVVGCRNSFHLEAAAPVARHNETLVAPLVVRMLQVVVATRPLMVEDLAVAEDGHQLLVEEGLQEVEAILLARPTLVWGL